MQLDRTRIAIRQRGFWEVLDLSLHVLRVHAGPLLLFSGAVILPLMGLNHLLIGWMADVDYSDQLPARFLGNMTLLVVLQAQLAGVLATVYLGQATFERPQWSRVFREAFARLPAIAWCQLVLRGVLLAWLVLLTVPRRQPEPGLQELLFLPLLLVGMLLVRALRPFINEIVLLERSPLRGSQPGLLTVGRRSSHLHTDNGGELFGRALIGSHLAVLLAVAVFGGLCFALDMLTGDARQRAVSLQLLYPAALWLVVIYFNVVRFLNYLDIRIRSEGWEVELRLRAEAARLEPASPGLAERR